ncbi:hypothetical protein MFP26_14420 [Brenneria sp. MC1SB4.1]|uniref:NAD synthetase n=2 Tax=Brenneria tiliae TaxID=2914984 RepID=A0ABT0MVJ7_9GAMM|nr:hypothetical protein [Brenneria tiliae]MCL2893881.1 hypothetical protein [Brenneria tiliae]
MLSYDFGRWTGNASGGDIDFNALANSLDCTRAFNQVGIIYADGKQRWLVRSSRRIANSSQSSVSHVVIAKVNDTVSPHHIESTVVDTLSSPFLATEITSTAFACGAMIVTLMMSIGAGAAVPFTAGGSGVIAAIGIAGSLATGAQCFIGGARLLAIGADRESYLTWIDSQDWYIATTAALDVISLAGAGAGLKGTIETYKLMKAVSPKKVMEWFQGLNRAERKRITEEIIRAQNPGISNAGIKASMRAGAYPKRFPTEMLQRELQRELVRAVVNTSAFAGSALTGTIRHPQNLAQGGKYVIGTIQSFSAN